MGKRLQCPQQFRIEGKMTYDHMLRREDLETILSDALAEKAIELDPKRLEQLLVLFLQGEYEIDQTKQPIIDQVERLAKEFVVSSSAQEIWNDLNTQ
jgi:hypothetical protein